MTHPDLDRALRHLPHGDPPVSVDEILQRARGRRRPPALPVGLALAAAAIFAVGLTSGGEALRASGGASGTPDVVLRAVAEGPDGTRALHADAHVSPHERVVFEVEGPTGTLVLTEDGPGGSQRVWPARGEAAVSAGRTLAGGASPQAWRPDDRHGTLTYTATLCDAEAACGEASLRLHWD